MNRASEVASKLGSDSYLPVINGLMPNELVTNENYVKLMLTEFDGTCSRDDILRMILLRCRLERWGWDPATVRNIANGRVESIFPLSTIFFDNEGSKIDGVCELCQMRNENSNITAEQFDKLVSNIAYACVNIIGKYGSGIYVGPPGKEEQTGERVINKSLRNDPIYSDDKDSWTLSVCVLDPTEKIRKVTKRAPRASAGCVIL